MLNNIVFVSAIIGGITLSSAAAAAPHTVTLDVPGMTCSSCPITVKKALTKVDGVQQAKVSYERREALVTFDDSRTSIEKITRAIANSGYPATVKSDK